MTGSEAEDSAHLHSILSAFTVPFTFPFSLLKHFFFSAGEPVQIAMSLDIASISSISESDMVSERTFILQDKIEICLRDFTYIPVSSTKMVILKLLCCLGGC